MTQLASLKDFDPQKRYFTECLLPGCPFVVLDERVPGVVAPAHLLAAANLGIGAPLIFRLGRTPGVMAIPDLEFTDWGWTATLTAQGTPYRAEVPWEAVIILYIAEPYVGPRIQWPSAKAPPTEVPAPEKPRPGLKLIK